MARDRRPPPVPRAALAHRPRTPGLGDSASIEELNERVIKDGDFSDEQQAVLHKEGPSTEIEYRIAWARTYLKGMGLADNSTRGVWSLTEHGGM